MDNFNFIEILNNVIKRVIERVWPNDWYFILNFCGLEKVVDVIKEVSYLNDKEVDLGQRFKLLSTYKTNK